MKRVLSADEKKFIAILRDNGVHLSVELTGGNYWLDEEMVARYMEDPDELEASFQGVTVDELRAYKSSSGETLCSATTRKGLPCKNRVQSSFREDYGSTSGDVRRWLNRQGRYCSFHSDSRDVARR